MSCLRGESSWGSGSLILCPVLLVTGDCPSNLQTVETPLFPEQEGSTAVAECSLFFPASQPLPNAAFSLWFVLRKSSADCDSKPPKAPSPGAERAEPAKAITKPGGEWDPLPCPAQAVALRGHCVPPCPVLGCGSEGTLSLTATYPELSELTPGLGSDSSSCALWLVLPLENLYPPVPVSPQRVSVPSLLVAAGILTSGDCSTRKPSVPGRAGGHRSWWGTEEAVATRKHSWEDEGQQRTTTSSS